MKQNINNLEAERSNKIRHDDITTLANSIAYITPLVSNHSDDISEIKEDLNNLSRRVDRIERNSD